MEARLKALGMRLRTLRQERGLTQAELAERAGLDQGHLARIERGTRWPRMVSLYCLADALGAAIGRLLDEHDEQAAEAMRSEVAALLDGCTERELRLLGEMVAVFRRYAWEPGGRRRPTPREG